MAKGHGKHGNKGHHHDDVMPSWAAALGIKWLGEDYDDIGRAWRGKGRNDVRDGTDRTTTHVALQEAFVEIHIADTSVNYDFISTKLGRQAFNSDFRSLLFSDVNQGVRIFGSANANRYQYNLLYFNMAEKDTNSELNTFGLRDQQVAIGADHHAVDHPLQVERRQQGECLERQGQRHDLQ